MGLLARSALLILVLDQASKWWVVRHMDLIHRRAIDVWPPWLGFRMAWNPGINFGLLAGYGEIMRWVLIALALGISGWVVAWFARTRQNRWAQLSAGLLVGGALGNVADRLTWGEVADFINMSCCGIDNPFAFNLADAAIFAGALGLVLTTGRDKTP